MAETIRYFLRGAGSVLQLMPCSPRNIVMRPDFMRGTDTDKLSGDWQRVGNHVRRAMTSEKVGANGPAK